MLAFARAGSSFPWSEIYLKSDENNYNTEGTRLEEFAKQGETAFPKLAHLMLDLPDPVLRRILPATPWIRRLEKITVVGALKRNTVERALMPLGVPLHFVAHKSIPFPYWYEVEDGRE